MLGITHLHSGFRGLRRAKEPAEGLVEPAHENDRCVYIGVYGSVERVCARRIGGARQGAGLNVSALTQAAISAELENSATDAWLEGLEPRSTGARHDDVLGAIDAARDEFEA